MLKRFSAKKKLMANNVKKIEKLDDLFIFYPLTSSMLIFLYSLECCESIWVHWKLFIVDSKKRFCSGFFSYLASQWIIKSSLLHCKNVSKF